MEARRLKGSLMRDMIDGDIDSGGGSKSVFGEWGIKGGGEEGGWGGVFEGLIYVHDSAVFFFLYSGSA